MIRRSNELWIGSDGDLIHYDGQQYNPILNGAPKFSKQRYLNELRLDEKGNLWLFYFNDNIELDTALVYLPEENKYKKVSDYLGKSISFNWKDWFVPKYFDNDHYVYFHNKKEKGCYIYEGELKFTQKSKSKSKGWILKMGEFLFSSTGKRSFEIINPKGEILKEVQVPERIEDINRHVDGSLSIITSDYENNNNLLSWYSFTMTDSFNVRLVRKGSFNISGKRKAIKSITIIDSNKVVVSTKPHGILFFRKDGKQLAFEKGGKLELSPVMFTSDCMIQGNVWLGSPLGIYRIRANDEYVEYIYQPDRAVDCRGIFVKENKVYFNNPQLYAIDLSSGKRELLNDGLYSNTIEALGNGLIMGSKGDGLFAEYVPLQKDGIRVGITSDQQRCLLSSASDYSLNGKQVKILGSCDGLHIYDYEKKTVERLDSSLWKGSKIPLKNHAINDIYSTSKGVWLGTNYGIVQLDRELRYVKRHTFGESPSSTPEINHIHRDRADSSIYWLATENGLIYWKPQSKEEDNAEFKIYRKPKAFFHSNTIYSVYEDRFNRLWLSTNMGIAYCDKSLNQFGTINSSVGLTHDEFNKYSHYQDEEEASLFYGGLGGIVRIKPDRFPVAESIDAEIYLREISAFNSKENEQEKIATFPSVEPYIKLNSHYQNFNIDIGMLELTHRPETREFFYRIGDKGLWKRTDAQISIPVLGYGKNKIHIKGKIGHLTGWTDEMVLEIFILKPWYLRWWALGSYFICLVAGIYFWWQLKNIRNLRYQRKLEGEVKKSTKKIRNQLDIIRDQNEKLKKEYDLRVRHFASIAHELQTPMSSILAPIKELINENNIEGTSNKLQILYRSVESLRINMRHIIDLVKLDLEVYGFDEKPGDLINATKKCSASFAPWMELNGLQFEFKSNCSAFWTSFDHYSWESIVFTLMHHAVTHSKEGTKIQFTIEIFPEYKLNHHQIKLEVKNVDSLFFKKQQFDGKEDQHDSFDSKKTDFGIGLTLVKNIIESQGGKFWINSVHSGSSLNVFVQMNKIPRKTEQDIPHSNFQEAPFYQNYLNSRLINIEKPKETDIAEEDKLDKSVLIVESDKDLRTYLSDLFENRGYDVEAVQSGTSSLEKIKNDTYDITVLDVDLRDINGLELCRMMKENDSSQHIPIVVLISSDQKELKQDFIKLGVEAFINKPFETKELLLWVENIMAKSEKIREQSQSTQSSHIAFINGVENNEKEWLEEVKEFVRNNLSNPQLNSQFLAENFYLSRMQFHRKMKRITGQSTAEFIRSIKLDEALSMLKNEKLSIKEIAYNTGFSTPSYFAQVFKKKFGKTPAQMRRKPDH